MRCALNVNRFGFAALLASLILTATSFGQAGIDIDGLRSQIFRSFERGDYPVCVDLIERYLQIQPHANDMWYNLACAHALQGQREQAATALYRAFKAGFNDITHMEHDPDLASIRDHPTYQKLLNEQNQVRHRDAQQLIAMWKARFGDDGYRFQTDEMHRLAYATALDPVAQREMQDMLESQADWLIRHMFAAPPDYFVLVAVPSGRHADELLRGDPSIGGMYDHTQRILVTRDIGGSLRHEFFHLMHYGHMERVKQRHPLWIQEGLASLFENYHFNADGSIQFQANERHNIIQRRERAGRVLSWKELFALSETRFMRQADVLYPQVRSMFEFVADQGKLIEWYEAYVAGFDHDKTGRVAFEEIFSSPLADVERRWRTWVRTRPEVRNVITYGDASLGIETRAHGATDGVLVTGILTGGAASTTRLRSGDVIVAFDGVPTRSLQELQAVIAQRSVGDLVDLRIRRNQQYLTIPVRLQPLRSSQKQVP